jgi:hypothetical protein
MAKQNLIVHAPDGKYYEVAENADWKKIGKEVNAASIEEAKNALGGDKVTGTIPAERAAKLAEAGGVACKVVDVKKLLG